MRHSSENPVLGKLTLSAEYVNHESTTGPDATGKKVRDWHMGTRVVDIALHEGVGRGAARPLRWATTVDAGEPL